MVDISFIVVILIGGFLSFYFNKLTALAALTGCIFSFVLYYSVGITGVTLMAGFFIIGTFCTSWKSNWKNKNNLTDHKKRNAGQVIANAGLATGFAFAALFLPHCKDLTLLIIASCFASATGDTASSELGNVYGKHFYNIINFESAQRGNNGAISLEGTLLGWLGSAFIAFIYGFFNFNYTHILAIFVGGVLGNISDSIFGTLLENPGYIKNNTVNFFNTLVAATTTGLIHYYFIR